MHRVYRYFASLFLIAAIAAPMSLMAAAVPQAVGVQVRVYDRGHKDYHNWDDHENQTWIRYRSDNHRNVREYSKASKRDQSQYWNYRHSHPDNN